METRLWRARVACERVAAIWMLSRCLESRGSKNAGCILLYRDVTSHKISAFTHQQLFMDWNTEDDYCEAGCSCTSAYYAVGPNWHGGNKKPGPKIRAETDASLGDRAREC